MIFSLLFFWELGASFVSHFYILKIRANMGLFIASPIRSRFWGGLGFLAGKISKSKKMYVLEYNRLQGDLGWGQWFIDFPTST